MSSRPHAAETTTDPIRADVEAALRTALRPATRLAEAPCRLASLPRRAATTTATLLRFPYDVVRTIAGVVGNAVSAGRADADDDGADDDEPGAAADSGDAGRDDGAASAVHPDLDLPVVAARRAAAAPDRSPAPPGAAGGDELPIDDYDTLPTANLVDRLERLSADELDVVAAYEAARRRRRTVLGRIDQLRSATS